MGPTRVAFQGELGACSEEALLRVYPDAEPAPCREFADVAAAVLERRADLGLLPIENSLVGSIATNFDLIADRGLAVVGEVVTPVHHALLELPGATRAAGVAVDSPGLG
jgi:prephenate dehydratase